MKYSSTNKPIVCMQTQSKCYKETNDKNMNIVGVLWHSTGANNPTLKRYVQPSDNASDREVMLKLIGRNNNNNDWNHISISAGLNCWIGKLEDGSITTIQTMPWNYKPWGCGSGKKGSCNNGWVQFEICEDSLKDADYFDKVYKEACEITAYICKMYDLDPYGTVMRNGVEVPVILCHADSCELGFGSNHGDVLHWFSKYNKTMEDVRNDVAGLLNGTINFTSSTITSTVTNTEFKLGDTVKVAPNAKYIYCNTFSKWLQGKHMYIRKLKGTTATLSLSKTGLIVCAINTKYLVKDEVLPSDNFKPYLVKVNTNSLNIRKNAGTNYTVIGKITDKGVYTIVNEKSGQGATLWLELKSGGYISADYVKRV